MKLILAIVLSYLIGSFPFGYLIARLKGIDIRQRGSGNIGTTNVWRNLGPLAGLVVFAGDVLKGVVAVLLGRYLLGGDAELLTALATLLGHSWSVFLAFKGGKIIATSLGVFAVLDWRVMLMGFLLWLVVVAVSRYISLGSILATASLPIWMIVLQNSWSYTIFSLMVAIIAIYKHMPNIRRLLNGTESRISW